MAAPTGTEGAPERIGDRYAIDARIGSGGMATVYLGRDLTNPSAGPVAIKRLHSWLAKEPELVAGLLDEARVVSRISHPNVVGMREVVVLEHEVFLVLEYVHGEPLSALLRTTAGGGKPVPVPIACAIACDVLRGLHAAHQAIDERGRPLGIVHRDVSPHNVIVGADGRAHLLDFGVAKAAGRLQSTRNGSIKGKLSYMAPEQLRGGLVSRRSDVYAAAIVLWEMLTGRALFDARRDPGAAVARIDAPIPPPSATTPGVKPALDAVVMRALAHEPRDRYATADEMALEIERHAGVASPRQVARWMSPLASSGLRDRADLLAGADGRGAPSGRSTSPAGDTSPAIRISLRAFAVAGVTAVVLLVILLARAWLRP